MLEVVCMTTVIVCVSFAAGLFWRQVVEVFRPCPSYVSWKMFSDACDQRDSWIDKHEKLSVQHKSLFEVSQAVAQRDLLTSRKLLAIYDICKSDDVIPTKEENEVR